MSAQSELTPERIAKLLYTAEYCYDEDGDVVVPAVDLQELCHIAQDAALLKAEAPTPASAPSPEIAPRPSPHPLDKLYADPKFQREYREELERERAAVAAQAPSDHAFRPDLTARKIEPNVASEDIGCAICGMANIIQFREPVIAALLRNIQAWLEKREPDPPASESEPAGRGTRG